MVGERYNAAAWLLDRHLDEGRGGRTAVVAGPERLTYEDLARLTRRVQRGLSALGVRPEERVAMVVRDGPAFLGWFLGCLRAGVVPVPLSTMLKGPELGSIVDDARARVAVVSAACSSLLPALVAAAPELSVAVVVGEAEGALSEEAPAEGPVEAPVEVVPFGDLDDDRELPVARTVRDSPAFWLYSSGTTGAPKGVMHRHGSLEATARTYAATVLEVGPEDRCFSAAKLFFAFGLGNALTFPLSVGATTILDPRPASPEMVAEVVARDQPTLFFGTPSLLAAMLAAEVDPRPFGSIRLAATAGEALPAEIHRRFTERFGFPVLDGLGSTEALHIFISNRPGAERPGTSGTPVAGYEVRLVDDEGREITEPGLPGNLQVAGPSIATGYWCRAEATQAAFEGRFLRTGDVYVRTEDGCYQFLGRTSDMIKAGGIWVSPAEVENVLLGHPDVAEAAVVGGRNSEGLEEVVAFVVPRPGSAPDPGSLEAHCREKMASFKRPRRIVLTDSLPKTATGKIQRYRLREEAGGGMLGFPGAPVAEPARAGP
jgi:benzoate-CoA ligase family protein